MVQRGHRSVEEEEEEGEGADRRVGREKRQLRYYSILGIPYTVEGTGSDTDTDACDKN